jgi:hypothetical protein
VIKVFLVVVLSCIVSCMARVGVVDRAVQGLSMTALHSACVAGHVECARLLLDRGAGVDVAGVSIFQVMRVRFVAFALRGVRQAWLGVNEFDC